ncbi:zinc finger, CCHC-type containing protein [Tanacetum coccineum]|uniref:Zinc finger, CCHC-type containing protein n=1 Tax=Tanacetum coccineum TaxID=301880 RepID=A0ABQ5GL44_9ASTR
MGTMWCLCYPTPSGWCKTDALSTNFASNWLECLPERSISTWEDLTTRFLTQFFPPGRIAKLQNDILMFQQHQGESLSEAWTRFKDLLQNVPHHGNDLWLQVQIFYDHVNHATRLTIDQAVGGKLYDKNTEESWALLKDLALYDNESWNDPRDFAKPVKAISLPQDVPSTSDRRLIELQNQVKTLDGAHASMYNAILDKYVESLELGKNGSAFIQGKMPEKMKDPGLFTLPYVMLNPFKDVLVFRKMVEFLGVIPINLKGNKWGLEELIKKKIEWNKPPKEIDGAWHIRIELSDPDGERFKKTFQSTPTTRKLSEKENPSEIIDLDHFHDF